MTKYKFTDCVEIAGSACQKFEGEKKYISTGAVAVDRIDEPKVEFITFEDKPSRANLVVEEGTLLFAKMQGTKKTILADGFAANHVYSTGFYAVKPKTALINNKCLYHLLMSNAFLMQKDKNCSGATQKAITNTGLAKIMVNVPLIDQQDEIAKRLDCINEIIIKQKKMLIELDELIKSRFVEMFGTLENPAQPFKKYALNDLCRKITDGKHGGCIQEDGSGRYFVGAREIYDDQINYDTAPEINIEEFEKDYKRCNVEIGDFLIVNTGATIGKSAIATDLRTEYTLLQKSVALLKVKHGILNPVFLKWCYRVNEKMYRVESASAQPNLLLSKIRSTEIYVPEIGLQNQFADFVEHIDKLKVKVQQSLDETQLLFDSLMQKYFG